MRGKKLLFLALPGLLLAIYSYISSPFSFSRSTGAETVPLVKYGQVVLDPPPLKINGEIVVPAGQILGAGNTYLPLSRALDLLGLPSASHDLNEVRLPAWGNSSSGQSHYRYYPVYNIQAAWSPERGSYIAGFFWLTRIPTFIL